MASNKRRAKRKKVETKAQLRTQLFLDTVYRNKKGKFKYYIICIRNENMFGGRLDVNFPAYRAIIFLYVNVGVSLEGDVECYSKHKHKGQEE